MDKLKELRMTLVILVIGTFFISGCFFNNKHTVTFKTNGGSEVKNVTVKNGSKLEGIEEPKKDGYIFDGWYLEGEEFDFDSKIDEDLTLVAKWIKVDVATTEPEEITTETTTAATTKMSGTTKTTTKSSGSTVKTTKKTTTTTTTKKVETVVSGGTTTGETVNKPSVVEPSTVTPTVGSETTESTNTLPTVNIDPVPTLPTETTEPTTEKTEEPVIQPTNLKIDINVEEVNHEDGSIEERETLVISKTTDESNVVGNVNSNELIKKLLESDMKTWIVTSGNGWNYIFDFKEDEDVTSLELKGDNKVRSFTVKLPDTSLLETESIFIFNYDEVEMKWYVQHPTVKVGTNTLSDRYFNDLQTAINFAKKGDTVTILNDIEVSEKISIPYPMIINGEGYTLTKTGDYLFDIENIRDYVEGDELIFENFDFMAESLIYRGSSAFDKVVISASEAVLGGLLIDNNYQLILNNTNFYSRF